MIKIHVSVNSDILHQLISALAVCEEGRFPATAKAMSGGAGKIAKHWREFAAGYKIPGVKPLKHGNKKYVEGVQLEQTGAFDHEIYNDSKEADRIAQGRQPVDMKKTHPYGPRSRVSQENIPYLIVPFRWGTPPDKGKQRVGFKNVMPRAVYNIVKNKGQFIPTKTTKDARDPTNTKKSLNARGELVGRAQYSNVDGTQGWGSQLRSIDIAGTIEQKRNMSGMTNMLGDDGKTAGYFTFRIMWARKPKNWDKRWHKTSFDESWVIPAEPARDVISALKAANRPFIEEQVTESMLEDLHDILPQ